MSSECYQQHPVQLMYQHLTNILSHALGDVVESDKPCTCCGRPAADFNRQAYQGNDSYGSPFNQCAACRAFFVTDVPLMGVERMAGRSTNPVGIKFGTSKGTGYILELATGRSILLVPPKTLAKIPEAFTSKVECVEITTANHIAFIVREGLTFPLLYVENFGVKTAELVNGLSISYSPAALVCCDDSGINSTNRATKTLDLQRVIKIRDLFNSWEPRVVTAVIAAVSSLTSGRLSPAQITEKAKEIPEIRQLIACLPTDPHQRRFFMSVAKKLISKDGPDEIL